MEGILPLLLWGGLFFLMMRFGCGSHMFGRGHGSRNHREGHGAHGGGCCGGHGADAGLKDEQEHRHPGPPEKSVDPVCGKTVRTNAARPTFHDGMVYFFCSRECREVFETAPHLYLNDPKVDVPTPPPQLEHRSTGDSSHA